jgi:predicted HTH domain antitoxin
VVGPPAEYVQRLAELAGLGIDRFHVELATRDQPAELVRQLRERLVREVLPAARERF